MRNIRRANCTISQKNFFPLLWNELFADDFYTKRNLQRLGRTVNRTLPSVNIRDEKERYLIEIVAAGFDKSDFEIAYDNNRLTISAKIVPQEETEKATYSQREFSPTAFERTFVIKEQEVDAENISAHYKAGVLYLSLPKVERETTKRRIQID